MKIGLHTIAICCYVLSIIINVISLRTEDDKSLRTAQTLITWGLLFNVWAAVSS